jgi:pantoate--beta-alanine ligase
LIFGLGNYKDQSPKIKDRLFMEIINRRKRMMSVARRLRREENRTIGLVPTMGALHEGHLSLIHEARALCDVVVVSVFVNPAQFGPAEDFASYPRDLTRDSALLAEYNVDYVFAPTAEEVYPDGFASYVTVEGLSDQLEGVARPGHFRGVTTVVAILLNIVRPHFAFFGQKDAQQSIIVKQMVRDLGFEPEIVVLPIVREESGLALSSRNAYLDESGRRAAMVLHRALLAARSAYADGERNAARLIELVRSMIENEPLARIDYVSVNDVETLEKLDKIDDRPALMSLAVFIGKTRLIDNIVLGQSEKSAVGANA